MAKAPIDIRSLARSHTETAIRTLAGIMGEPKCPPAARVKAAEVLLDRGWGKAPQTMTVNRGDNAKDLSDGELSQRIKEALQRIDGILGGDGAAPTGPQQPDSVH